APHRHSDLFCHALRYDPPMVCDRCEGARSICEAHPWRPFSARPQEMTTWASTAGFEVSSDVEPPILHFRLAVAATGVSRKACNAPFIMPLAMICPLALIATAASRTHPKSIGMKSLRSTGYPGPLLSYRNACDWPSAAYQELPTMRSPLIPSACEYCAPFRA